jgi:predicted metal-dependent hydrolase
MAIRSYFATIVPMADNYQTLVVNGVALELKVVRKRVKNINARLDGSTLSVSAPHRVSRAELDATIEQLARRLVRRARADAINGDGGAEAIARKMAERFPDPPRVTGVRWVTNQSARWGSYSPLSGVIRLSATLRLMPPWVLEAVVAHELAHAVHVDHSPAFWKLVKLVCPQTDKANAFLDGVSWLASSWRDLPPVERAQLAGDKSGKEDLAPLDALTNRDRCGQRGGAGPTVDDGGRLTPTGGDKGLQLRLEGLVLRHVDDPRRNLECPRGIADESG